MAYSDKIKLSHEKIPFCISHFSNKRQYSTFRSRRDFIWRSSCWRYITIPRNVTNMIWISEKYGREYDRNMIFYFSGRGHSISPPPYSHQQCLTLLPEMKYFSIRKKKKLQKVRPEMRELFTRITKKDWDETEHCRISKNHCKKSEPAPWDHHELVQNKQNFENGFMCHVLQKIFSLWVSGNAKSKK